MDYKSLVSDCIHCGACKENCEFLKKYDIILSDTELLKDLAYNCFLCGTCTRVCPVNIDGKALVLQMRRDKVAENDGKMADKGYDSTLKEKKKYLFKNYKHATGKSALFTGCNFPSFYPETTKKLAEMLKEKAGVGIIFDCCGKPISELGLKKEEEEIADRINRKLEKAGIEELVMVCPNCYYFLTPRLNVRVVSIYEKLRELGIGKVETKRMDVFVPCPDKTSHSLLEQMKQFLPDNVNLIQGVQCCGLGGSAGVKEPEIAAKLPALVKERNYSDIYSYCASCAGNLTRAGCNNVHHILVDILETGEKPDTNKALFNRMKAKFY